MLDIIALSLMCVPEVAPETMAAIVRHESGASAYAININGAFRLTRQPTQLAEAVDIAQRLRARGLNFDAGLGQINSDNVAKFGATWAEVFDPCSNLKLAARVLKGCYTGATAPGRDPQRALAMALSCYNTGNYASGFSNGYVAAVYGAAIHGAAMRERRPQNAKPDVLETK